jgi:ribonuclease P/MRP protein subunit POP5
VSGTIRKAEEEAIRRARDMITRARREMGEQSAGTLDKILGKAAGQRPANGDADLTMVDRSDSDEEDLSDGDG